MRESERHSDDPEPPGAESGSTTRAVTDAIRRLVASGAGRLLTPEDSQSLRSAIGDLKLPKEAAAYLVAQVDRTKDEVVKALGRELRAFLESVDVYSLAQRGLAGLTVEVHAEVKFRSAEDGKATPQLQVTTHTRRQRPAGTMRSRRTSAAKSKTPPKE